MKFLCISLIFVTCHAASACPGKKLAACAPGATCDTCGGVECTTGHQCANNEILIETSTALTNILANHYDMIADKYCHNPNTNDIDKCGETKRCNIYGSTTDDDIVTNHLCITNDKVTQYLHEAKNAEKADNICFGEPNEKNELVTCDQGQYCVKGANTNGIAICWDKIGNTKAGGIKKICPAATDAEESKICEDEIYCRDNLCINEPLQVNHNAIGNQKYCTVNSVDYLQKCTDSETCNTYGEEFVDGNNAIKFVCIGNDNITKYLNKATNSDKLNNVCLGEPEKKNKPIECDLNSYCGPSGTNTGVAVCMGAIEPNKYAQSTNFICPKLSGNGNEGTLCKTGDYCKDGECIPQCGDSKVCSTACMCVINKSSPTKDCNERHQICTAKIVIAIEELTHNFDVTTNNNNKWCVNKKEEAEKCLQDTTCNQFGKLNGNNADNNSIPICVETADKLGYNGGASGKTASGGVTRKTCVGTGITAHCNEDMFCNKYGTNENDICKTTETELILSIINRGSKKNTEPVKIDEKSLVVDLKESLESLAKLDTIETSLDTIETKLAKLDKKSEATKNGTEDDEGKGSASKGDSDDVKGIAIGALVVGVINLILIGSVLVLLLCCNNKKGGSKKENA